MLRAKIIVASLCVGLAASASAAPPWAKLVPFRKVEADPEKFYELTESEGPWMILCTSFAGPKAREQAHELVLELRSRYKLEAYVFARHFDFTEPEVGLGVTKYGGPRKMRHQRSVKFDEYAVLVGNFHSVDQPEIEKTREIIRHLTPECLAGDSKETNQQFGNFRRYIWSIHPDQRKRQKGPMGNAFVTKNPLLPDEYFAPKGLDPFVVDLNKDLPYSLLNNPGKYTVKVASFRGAESIEYQPAKIASFEESIGKPREGSRSRLAKIDEAAMKASKLTAALREKGVEAYEFHDRTESIVCVGSFDSVGSPRPDGKIEINPAIHRIMQEYGPEKVPDPSLGPGQLGLRPRTLNGIPFDVQPLPVMVPKRSLAQDYVGREG
jgi:hypothetical protein